MNEEEIQIHSSSSMIPTEEREEKESQKRSPRVFRKMRSTFALIKIQRQRNPEIFARLYDEHVEKIYRYIFLKVASKELAEDIAGETFLKAWHCLQETKEVIHDSRAFLYRIARNLVFDYYRKKAHADVLMSDEALETLVQENHEIKKIEERSEFEYIESFLKRLKEEYQEVLLLRYVEGLSIGEIASILEKKKGATRVLIHRAMNTLKKMIEERKII